MNTNYIIYSSELPSITQCIPNTLIIRNKQLTVSLRRDVVILVSLSFRHYNTEQNTDTQAAVYIMAAKVKFRPIMLREFSVEKNKHR